MNNNENKTFTYTYSAKEQEELKRIREKYIPQEMDKMEQLRRLDRSVTTKATMWSITLGIIGCLILGGGMSMAMVAGDAWMIPGIIVGIVGIAVLAPAYPLYHRIVKKERERIAPEVLRLTDELLK